MIKYHSIRYTSFLLISDLVFVLSALFLSYEARKSIDLGRELLDPDTNFPQPVYVIAILIWMITFLLLNVYEGKRTASLISELQTLTVATSIAWLTFLGVLYLTFRLVSRLQTIYFVIIYLVLIYTHRLVVRYIFKLRGGQRFNLDNVAIIGATALGREVAASIKNFEWLGLKLIGFISDDPDAAINGDQILGPLAEARSIIEKHNISEVIFALDPHLNTDARHLVYELQNLRVNIRVVPDYFELAFLRMTIEELGELTLLTLKEPVIDPFQRVVKRIMDLMLAMLMLIPGLPLMALIAILIRLDSPGPAIFRQMRLGEARRVFKMYKFRSMTQDAEERVGEVIQVTEDGNILHKHRFDPRVTWFGRFLRRSSLDELPQLFNVLRGEMSLVGPRPELPYMVDRYSAWQLKRFEVPQGMTGWWQINGRAERPMHLSTEQDLYYIQHYSLLLDIQILWRTLGTIISGRGAF